MSDHAGRNKAVGTTDAIGALPGLNILLRGTKVGVPSSLHQTASGWFSSGWAEEGADFDIIASNRLLPFSEKVFVFQTRIKNLKENRLRRCFKYVL